MYSTCNLFNVTKKYLTYNEEKSAVAERFIKTLKSKVFKYMTADSLKNSKTTLWMSARNFWYIFPQRTKNLAEVIFNTSAKEIVARIQGYFFNFLLNCRFLNVY